MQGKYLANRICCIIRSRGQTHLLRLQRPHINTLAAMKISKIGSDQESDTWHLINLKVSVRHHMGSINIIHARTFCGDVIAGTDLDLTDDQQGCVAVVRHELSDVKVSLS